MCFPWGLDDEDEVCAGLKLLLVNRLSYLQANGAKRFFVSMDEGVGLYVAEIVLSLMETNETLQLFITLPCEGQAVKWPPELRDRYFAVLQKCTSSIVVSDEHTLVCELDAMLKAVDEAQSVLAVCADKNPPQDKTFATVLHYAYKMGKDVQLITPPEMFK